MKKIVVFSFAVLWILSVNGIAADMAIITSASFEDSSAVPEDYSIEDKISSTTGSDQGMRAIPEPIALLILGYGLIGFGKVWRKTLSQRCIACPLT